MNKNIEIIKSLAWTSLSTSSKEKASGGTECDEAYRQINKTSFQNNFKALIGHYKSVVDLHQSAQSAT